MKKYNIDNYLRYKEDLKESIKLINVNEYKGLSRDQMIVKFMPLVENLARKFSTSQQASGVLSINDLIQEGNFGLIKAVDRLDWDQLDSSEDLEKTLKSFFSKRIKGAIRRAIDINRGDIKIPEHKLTEIRKNPEDNKMVALFFNSMFSSYDVDPANEENFAYQLPDNSKSYSIDLLNIYLLGIMKKHLTPKQYDVVRLFYGLDCDKQSAKQIAEYVNITVPTAAVIVSQIKKEAIDYLIANVEEDQVIDYL